MSALGERLWSNPSVNWKNNYMDTEIRMVNHRHLLVDRGIKADALQIEYCFQNEGSCELHNNVDPDPPNTGVTFKECQITFLVALLLNAISLIFPAAP